MQILLGLAGPGSAWKMPDSEPAGFFGGLWHGLLFPFTFWISLLWPSVRIYETKNSGRWYDFGFVLGTGLYIGGGSQVGR